MKKVFVVILVLFSGFYLAQAQTIKPTTPEEYNIGLAGYKMFVQMKVDIKKGYKINDLSSFEYGERKADFKGLYRDGETKPCAVIMVYSKLRGAPEYYCIPTADAPEELWDRLRTASNGETDSKSEQLQFFSFALAKGMMWFATK